MNPTQVSNKVKVQHLIAELAERLRTERNVFIRSMAIQLSPSVSPTEFTNASEDAAMAGLSIAILALVSAMAENAIDNTSLITFSTFKDFVKRMLCSLTAGNRRDESALSSTMTDLYIMLKGYYDCYLN